MTWLFFLPRNKNRNKKQTELALAYSAGNSRCIAGLPEQFKLATKAINKNATKEWVQWTNRINVTPLTRDYQLSNIFYLLILFLLLKTNAFILDEFPVQRQRSLLIFTPGPFGYLNSVRPGALPRMRRWHLEAVTKLFTSSGCPVLWSKITFDQTKCWWIAPPTSHLRPSGENAPSLTTCNNHLRWPRPKLRISQLNSSKLSRTGDTKSLSFSEQQ